jgi:dipeptidyl aminopeptidase/acylaminoacyl peptidase
LEPIAYVGNDRQLYLLDALESAPRCLTADAPDGAFTWPTWNRDRTAVAVMRRVRAAQGERGAVELRAVADGTARRLWTARDGGPVFLYWAPNGERLGLLVQETDNLHLLAAPRSGDRAEPVLTGAPLYWGWAPDGTALVAHVGGHYRRGDGARVVHVRLDRGAATSETLSVRPLGFRAPAWEPEGTRVAYAAASQANRGALVLADVASGQVDEVAAVGDQPAFVWAPQGGRLAFAADRSDAGLYEGVSILDATSGATWRLPHTVLAFFWLPDGEALLCATVDPGGDRLAWERVDLATDEAVALARFTPTQELGLLLGHFDQYAPAVALYSREEPALLFADAGQEGRHNGHSAERADLWLATGTAPAALRHLAGGSVGFFAP